jgi:hypothetical protein
MKRLTLIWLTVLALLAQGWSAAAMGWAVSLPAKAETVVMAGMEHCAMHEQSSVSLPSADSALKSGDCCGAALDCHCVSVCSSAALLPALFALSQLPAALPISRSVNAGVGAAPAAHPFRPPIL